MKTICRLLELRFTGSLLHFLRAPRPPRRPTGPRRTSPQPPPTVGAPATLTLPSPCACLPSRPLPGRVPCLQCSSSLHLHLQLCCPKPALLSSHVSSTSSRKPSLISYPGVGSKVFSSLKSLLLALVKLCDHCLVIPLSSLRASLMPVYDRQTPGAQWVLRKQYLPLSTVCKAVL